MLGKLQLLAFLLALRTTRLAAAGLRPLFAGASFRTQWESRWEARWEAPGHSAAASGAGAKSGALLRREARRCAARFAESCDGAPGPLPGCLGGPLEETDGQAPAGLVSFALVTGAAYANAKAVKAGQGRPWAQRETWLRSVRPGSWAYFSDAADGRLPAYEISGTGGGWGPSQRKWLGILARLAKGEPPFDSPSYFPRGSKWLFIGDDDTFVWPDTLSDRLHEYDGNPDVETLYLGLPDRSLALSVGIDLGEADSYCLGGAGFLISRQVGTILQGQDIQTACGDVFDNGAHADVAFARCLARTVGVKKCRRFPGLNQEAFPDGNTTSDTEVLGGAEGDYPNCAPVSFHWMQPVAMRQLWAKGR